MEDEEGSNDEEEDEDDDGTNNTQPSGEEVFKRLVTEMNEIGEILIQFHIFTDSHDQILAASLLEGDLCLQADSSLLL